MASPSAPPGPSVTAIIALIAARCRGRWITGNPPTVRGGQAHVIGTRKPVLIITVPNFPASPRSALRVPPTPVLGCAPAAAPVACTLTLPGRAHHPCAAAHRPTRSPTAHRGGTHHRPRKAARAPYHGPGQAADAATRERVSIGDAVLPRNARPAPIQRPRHDVRLLSDASASRHSSRLLKKAHLRRSRARAALRRTS